VCTSGSGGRLLREFFVCDRTLLLHDVSTTGATAMGHVLELNRANASFDATQSSFIHCGDETSTARGNLFLDKQPTFSMSYLIFLGVGLPRTRANAMPALALFSGLGHRMSLPGLSATALFWAVRGLRAFTTPELRPELLSSAISMIMSHVGIGPSSRAGRGA
jgi:hypothetical protein